MRFTLIMLMATWLAGCVERTDAPSTDTPSTDTPSSGVPSTDTPSTDTPSTDIPSTGVPITGVPSSVDSFDPVGTVGQETDRVDPEKIDEEPTELAPIPDDRSLSAPASQQQEQETDEILEAYVGPDQRVRDSMSPPPDAKSLAPKDHLWIDRAAGNVILDGYVTMRRGVLEMFACPMGSKEHESVVATLAKPSQVHAALLAVGASPGTPVQFNPKFVPATGQLIRVWVCWRDSDGKFHAVDARRWIQQTQTDQSMAAEWVFAGSGFWKDPSDGREYYQADSGDMICVSNFSTAMIDISIASSAESGQLMFQPSTDDIPKRGTPVRLVLVPIPDPIDSDDKDKLRRHEEETKRKKTDPPEERVLPPLTVFSGRVPGEAQIR